MLSPSKQLKHPLLINFIESLNRDIPQRRRSADAHNIPPKLPQNLPQTINISPDKLHTTVKPKLPPKTVNGVKKRKISQPLIHRQYKHKCINHADKEGSYRAYIEDEVMFYCTKCSMQLASQGFAVQKISDNDDVGYSQKRRTLSGNISFALQNSCRFRQIQQFLSGINVLKGKIKAKMWKFQDLPKHYERQQAMIEGFYDSLLSYISSLKEQNIESLRMEGQKQVEQSKSIVLESDRSLAQLESISSDISINIKDILEKISEEKFRNCINFYKEKLLKYQQRMGDSEGIFRDVTNYVQSDCDLTYEEIVRGINTRLGVSDQRMGKNQQHPLLNFQSFGLKSEANSRAPCHPFKRLFTSDESESQFKEPGRF